jgi:arsenate reductase-like glutaredoxin family protein
MDVQIFGTRKSTETKKALRFFSERGVKVHFVDLGERPIARGELRRFVERFGVEALIDRGARRFAQLGLAAAPPSTGPWLERLLAEPLLLRQPLVRCQDRLSVGLDEGEWTSWRNAETR